MNDMTLYYTSRYDEVKFISAISFISILKQYEQMKYIYRVLIGNRRKN